MSTDPPDLSGLKVGEYEITARIGLGGMGAVYEGRQPLIGKRVAVKVLLPQLSADKELVERFLSEARAVNEIRHRGIVDIFSFGQLPSKEHYFVMEYLQGKAFDRLIKESAPVPFAQALHWIEETCEALQAAHETGIIHRDIKPSNIFLVDTGRGRPYVKLLDFGIAKLGASLGEATPQTRASVVIGTPDYMSPEQARGKPISPATDIYALGCVLFELVTGRRPFKGENSLQTMFMHVEEPAPKASSFNRSVMPELDDLLLWTMQKEGKDRPESAEVLRQHCEQLRNMMVASTPTGPYQSVPGTPGSKVPAVRTPIPRSGSQARAATPSPRSARQQPVTSPPPSGATGWRVSNADDVGAPTSISGRSKSVEQPQVTKEEHVVPLGYESTKLRPALDPNEDLAAPTAKTPSVKSAAVKTRAEQPALALNTTESPPFEPPSKSKAPIFIVVGVLLVGSAVGVYAFMSHGSPQPQNPIVVEEIPLPKPEPKVEPKPDPVVVKPEVKPEPKPEPKPEVKPEPKPEPKVIAKVEPKPEPKPEVKPEPKPEPKPKTSGLANAVQTKLANFEKKLKAKEASSGDTYPMWHKYLDRFREQAKTADTDAKRRELIQSIDDSAAQL